MLKLDKQQPYKIAYLVQCRKHWDYLFELQTDTTDLYVLTFKKPLRYPKGITSIYYPKSSWNEGRNKLYEVAKAKGYDYYVFLDDDVILNVADKQWHPFRYLEAMINYYSPAALVGNFDWHFGNVKRFDNEIQTIYQTDACCYAMHKDVAEKVLPYNTKWDKISWWNSQYYLSQIMHANFPSGTIQANHLVVRNPLHDDYPRTANVYTDCDLDLMQILTPEQKETFIGYHDSLYINDGEFKPITFFQ